MQKFETKIIDIADVSSRTKIFKIKIPDYFDFTPGQFVIASMPGLVNESGLPIRRPYSIASSPLNKAYIELCIALAPKGKFSAKLHSTKIGDSINIEGPYGTFKLKKPVRAGTVFIAGGTGIAPLMSMMRTIFAENPKPIYLLYCIRNEKEFLYRKELENYNNLKLVVVSEDGKWTRDKVLISEMLEKYLSKTDAPVYVCGPPAMVKATVEKLKRIGFLDEQINKEQW